MDRWTSSNCTDKFMTTIVGNNSIDLNQVQGCFN